jgi:hypothetical protein
LLVIEVVGTVCGKPICGPCNFQHGNEGVFRCPVHSTVTDESSDDEVVQIEKENVPLTSVKVNKGKGTGSKKTKAAGTTKGSNKGNEYTAKDLLILSQAYIRTSENAIDGTSQKRNKFCDDVAVAFDKLKKQQEAYDARTAKRGKYNTVSSVSDFLSDTDGNNDDSDNEKVIPSRTPSSLQQKWSKFVLPLVTKFICLTHRYPRGSGEGVCLLFYSFVSAILNFYSPFSFFLR